MKYTFTDGTPYEGPTIKMPDGRILSGATYMPDSRRLVAVPDMQYTFIEDASKEESKDGGQRGRELHQTNNAEKPVQQNKVRNKGRQRGSMVGKKSTNAGKTI